MRWAFKEWAIIVDALSSGVQTIILRKGGISEGKGGFKVEHPEFLLFPTLFHQQRESVVTPAQVRYDQIAPAFPPPGILRIEAFARVARVETVTSLEQLASLRPFHIWRDEVVRERFDWSRQKLIHFLVVRTFRLVEPLEMPLLESYGGCKSWIELKQDIPAAAARPVLSDSEFEARLAQIAAVLAE
jgi:hypothetical protein